MVDLVSLKRYIPYFMVLLLGAWGGFFVGTQYFPRLETKTLTNTVEKPIVVQGEARTETKTQIAYVPKETVIERYIDASTGKEITANQQESTDFDAQIGKPDFNVKLNGQPIQFTKGSDERFMFDKNKVMLDQTNTIAFEATVAPYVIDQTKRWGLGVGYGNHGMAYKMDFPIGGNDYFGGWVYKDDESRAGGVALRF